MPKLILDNNYLLEVDNISSPKNIKKVFNRSYKLINRNGSKLVFTNGEKKFTLWNNHRYNEYYCCYLTLENNNSYRTTKYGLNTKSIYVWIRIYTLELNYLKSYSCITTLHKLLALIEFYNKINVKKNLKRVPSITKVFRDNYIIRYISEFL
jgi:hypothetical protein